MRNILLKVKNCPRCEAKIVADPQTTWHGNCKNCRLVVYLRNDNNISIYILGMIDKDDELDWQIDNNLCKYWPTYTSDPIILPLLPYTISKERLKLLLLMS